MGTLNGIDKALLKKISMISPPNNIIDPIDPCTLIAKLKHIFPDLDDLLLERSWGKLVNQGFAKDIPLKVIGNYGRMNNMDEFLTDKGIEAIYR